MALFAQVSGVSELAHGCEMSLLCRHSDSDEVLFSLVTMEGHLFVEFAAEAIAAEKKTRFSGMRFSKNSYASPIVRAETVDYSARSALIGSACVARYAGMKQATSDTAITIKLTARNVAVSVGLTLNTRFFKTRAITKDAAMPKAAPNRVSLAACESTKRMTLPCSRADSHS